MKHRRTRSSGVSSSMGKHNWAAIGSAGDAMDCTIYQCRDCGKYVTLSPSESPENLLPACIPKPRPPSKRKRKPALYITKERW